MPTIADLTKNQVMIYLARVVAIAIAAPFVLLALLIDVPIKFAVIVLAAWRHQPSAIATRAVVTSCVSSRAVPIARQPTHTGSDARH
jgi:hypothetical protein